MRAVEFKKSFDRTYRKLELKDRLKTDRVIGSFLTSLEFGRLPEGLGLKRLRGDLWEIRVDLSLRVGFRMQKDQIQFGIVGTHETIKRFIKNF